MYETEEVNSYKMLMAAGGLDLNNALREDKGPGGQAEGEH
jgi:hypothetical protein